MILFLTFPRLIRPNLSAFEQWVVSVSFVGFRCVSPSSREWRNSSEKKARQQQRKPAYPISYSHFILYILSFCERCLPAKEWKIVCLAFGWRMWHFVHSIFRFWLIFFLFSPLPFRFVLEQTRVHNHFCGSRVAASRASSSSASSSTCVVACNMRVLISTLSLLKTK